MGRPPKVKDFDVEVPDLDKTSMSKGLMQIVKETILRLRSTVLIKGILANDLMDLHRSVERASDVEATWNSLAHVKSTTVMPVCKYDKANVCVYFMALTLAKWVNDFTYSTLDANTDDMKKLLSAIKVHIARLNAIGVFNLDAFKVVGSERDGFYLSRKSD